MALKNVENRAIPPEGIFGPRPNVSGIILDKQTVRLIPLRPKDLYVPTDQIDFRLVLNKVIDPATLTLNFNLQTTGTGPIFDDGAHAVIERLQVGFNDGPKIEQIDAYSLLHGLMAKWLIHEDYKGSVGTREGYYRRVFGSRASTQSNASGVPQPLATENSWNSAFNAYLSSESLIDFKTATSREVDRFKTVKRQVSIPLDLAGLLQRKLLYVSMLGSVDISITLQKAASCMGCNSDVAVADVSYKLSDVELTCDVLDFSPEYMTGLWESLKSGISWDYNTWDSFRFTPAASGSYDARLQKSYQSVRSAFVVLQKTFVMDTTDVSIINKSGYLKRFGVTSYQVFVDGRPFSSHEIPCGAAASSEAMYELQKAMDTTGRQDLAVWQNDLDYENNGSFAIGIDFESSEYLSGATINDLTIRFIGGTLSGAMIYLFVNYDARLVLMPANRITRLM